MGFLVDMTSPDLVEYAPRTLLVPLGSFEQHGPHLPLDTDTRIGSAIAAEVAMRRSDVLVSPALEFGASGEHQGFPGTLSIGTEAMRLVLIELARSMGPEFDGLILLSWHGGNGDALKQGVDQLRTEGHRVVAITPRLPTGDAHAGRTETSIMLALDPDRVKQERAVAGNTQPLSELLAELRQGGLKTVTETGVLGDPAGASAIEGDRLLANLADAVIDRIDRWQKEAKS